MKCPKCKGDRLYWQQLSTGGDGLLFCPDCDWVEDPTKDDEEQVE